MNEIKEGAARRLKKWRREIDRIDNALLRLLSRRAAIACELGAVKIASGLPAYDGRRERQVLARMRDANQGPLSGESVARIFHRIILETRRIGIESMREQRRKARAVGRLGTEQRNGH
jgi:chorismate mutase-like protein